MGWTSTGQKCGRNGCRCWRKNISITSPLRRCHDVNCKGVCNEQSPGIDWIRVGRCQGRCSCWRKMKYDPDAVGYQTLAQEQQLECPVTSSVCDQYVGGTCIPPPDPENWYIASACDSGSQCKCWVRKSGSCNGRCSGRGQQCSNTSPGMGWTSTGQTCGKIGCKCWRKNISINYLQECHDVHCKGVCSVRSPGRDWYKAGDCQDKCSCWMMKLTSIEYPDEIP